MIIGMNNPLISFAFSVTVLGLIAVSSPFVAHAYYVDAGCVHHVTDLATGSGGYSGESCTLEVLTELSMRTDITEVERSDARKAVAQMRQQQVTISGTSNTTSSQSPEASSTPTSQPTPSQPNWLSRVWESVLQIMSSWF